ncbi:hypothetical protein ACLVWU_05550 [Bdellovibrio sp. HCB290]|uniref:hypothetical protein n=1 Tax=Bdellovibrio sp. HCB290 TaxID=3394356 RepID=UPI0039B43C6E
MKWMIAALVTLSAVSSQAQADVQVKFDSKKCQLDTLINTYAEATGQKFVVDAGVRGNACIILPGAVSKDEAFNQLSSALALNGFAISTQGDTMIVRAARNVQRDAIEVTKDLPAQKPERMVTWIYTFKNISAMDVNRDIRMFPSKDGELNVNARANQIIFSDWSSNIQRIAALLKELDKPVDPATAKLVAEAQKKSAKSRSEAKKEEVVSKAKDN